MNTGRYSVLPYAAITLGIGGLAYYYLMGDNEPEPQFVPNAITPAQADQAREAYLTLLQATKNVLGRNDPAIVQYAFANGRLETGWGRWPFKTAAGEKVDNQHNWGSIHCRESDISCVEASDAHSSGNTTDARYVQRFRAYPNALAGAEDMVREMFVRRPQVLRALTASDPSVMGASIAMRRTKYVTGWCPKATVKYGAKAVERSFAHPDESVAAAECAKEAITTHAKTIGQALADFLPAVKVSKALRFGSYDQDFAAYKRREKVR